MLKNLNNEENEKEIMRKTTSFAEGINYFINSTISISYFLLKQKWRILRNVIFSIIIFLPLLSLIPNVYSVESSFVIPENIDIVTASSLSNSPNPLVMAGLSVPNIYNSDNEDRGLLYVGILNSRTISENIIIKNNLINKLKVKNIDLALKKLRKNMTLIRSDQGMLKISVTTDNPKLSADIANQYIVELSILLNKINLLAITNQREFLEQRMKEVQKDLNTLNKRLTNFKINNKAIDIKGQSDKLINDIADLRGQIISKEAVVKGLKMVYTDNSPLVKALKAEIDSLKNKLNQISGANFPAEYGNVNVGSEIGFLGIPLISNNYIEISRNVKILENVFELIIKEYEITKLKEANKGIILKIIDKAVEPSENSNPPKGIIIFFVFMVTTIFSIIYYIFKYYFVEQISKLYPETYQNLVNFKQDLINELLFFKRKRI